ncbi:unnamed protein product, partial [Rotaria magnacalcarata]
MVRDTGWITLLRSMGRPRTVTTEANIQK